MKRKSSVLVFLCVSLFLAAAPRLVTLEREPDSGYATAELAVYAEIGRYRSFIERESARFGVDPVVVYAILYIEKIQYELDPLHRVKLGLEASPIASGLYLSRVAEWASLSVGFAHIKPAFARETKRRLDLMPAFAGYLMSDETRPEYYGSDPRMAIRIMVAGLFLLGQEWRLAGVDIARDPGVLATLYNLGYERSAPHPDPEVGGTTLPVVIDGQLVENMPFGKKVAWLCTRSRVLRAFADGDDVAVGMRREDR